MIGREEQQHAAKVTTATGWTRSHAVFAQMFQYLSKMTKWSMHRAHQALLFFSALSAEPQLRAKKLVFIPDLIPQLDWDKYHLFRDKSHI